MSVQTMWLEELGREFDETIADHPKHEVCEEARAAVEADGDVQEFIMKLNQLRREFNVSRQMGEATQEGFRKVQAAREELHPEPVIEGCLLAQAELVGELEKIDEAISGPLAVDFGGGVGGCCND